MGGNWCGDGFSTNHENATDGRCPCAAVASPALFLVWGREDRHRRPVRHPDPVPAVYVQQKLCLCISRNLSALAMVVMCIVSSFVGMSKKNRRARKATENGKSFLPCRRGVKESLPSNLFVCDCSAGMIGRGRALPGLDLVILETF